jgi:hypothetical protein
MRLSEEAYAAYIRRGQPAPVSEAAWMSAIRRLAKDAGFTFQYHVFDSRRTVYGWPDLVLCHREPGYPLYLIEAKTDVGRLTPAQAAWLEALQGCTGVVAEVWRPAQLQEIVERLCG